MDRLERPKGPSPAQRRVLVVGSDLLAETLASALQRRGLAARQVAPREPDLDAAIASQPSLALLDVRSLNPAVGSALVARLRQASVAVCVIAGPPNGHELREWLEAGASATIDEGSPFDQLFRTINRLLGCSSSIDRTSGTAVPHIEETSDAYRRIDLFAILTEREQHVLAELMEGHCAEEIANAAFVSVSTVRSHIKAILQKLGVNSQLAAVALARRAGWSIDRATR